MKTALASYQGQMKTQDTQRLPTPVSLPKVAKMLDISKRGVYRLIASGELPHPVKIGGCSKLFLHQIEDYLRRLEDKQTGREHPFMFDSR